MSWLTLFLFVAAGCEQTTSTTTTPGASPSAVVSPSASLSSVASPSPLLVFPFPVATDATCPDLESLGRGLALLRTFDVANRVILCDARDKAHPRIVQAFDGSTPATFLRQDLIGYIAQKGGGSSAPSDQFTSVVSTLSLSNGQITELGSSQGRSWAAGWSADGSMVAYFTDSGGVHHYWLQRGNAGPVEFSTPVPVFGRGGISDDQSLVAFSHDGQYVLVVDTAVNRLQAFRTSDAASVFAAPSGGAGGLGTMAVWAHNADRFYFRNDSGVYQWDASSGISSVIGGLQWSRPTLTPDDRFVAYMVWISNQPQVQTRDLSTGRTITFPGLRDDPVFVGETTLLVHEEVYCDACIGPYNWTGKTFVIHTDTRAEADLGTTGSYVGPFWPPA